MTNLNENQTTENEAISISVDVDKWLTLSIGKAATRLFLPVNLEQITDENLTLIVYRGVRAYIADKANGMGKDATEDMKQNEARRLVEIAYSGQLETAKTVKIGAGPLQILRRSALTAIVKPYMTADEYDMLLGKNSVPADALAWKDAILAGEFPADHPQFAMLNAAREAAIVNADNAVAAKIQATERASDVSAWKV